MALKKILSIIIITITLNGCAAKIIDTSQIDVLKLENIKYGIKLTALEKHINHSGLPLFKFYSNQKTYYVMLVRPSLYYQSYLFLFEDNSLISVVKTETGVKIWEDNFGTYKYSIPTEKHFSRVISRLKSNVNSSCKCNSYSE